jgi:hypothetical protein
LYEKLIPRVKRKIVNARKKKKQEAEGANGPRVRGLRRLLRSVKKKKKKRPAWPAGAVQSATCGALCAANHEKDHK